MKRNNISLCLLLAGFLIVLTLPLIFAIECQDQTDVEDIPCEVISPILPSGTCNATISSVLYPEINQTINMTSMGDGRFNFTFPYSNISTYKLATCYNDTATIDIGHWDEDYFDKWLYFYGFSLLLGGGLIVFGFTKPDYIMTLLGGLLFLAFAIVFVAQGYPTLTNNTVKLSIILITFGIGGYFTLGSGIKIAQEGL